MVVSILTIQKILEEGDQSFLPPVSENFQKLLSVTCIDVKDVENLPHYSKEQVLLFYKVIIRVIDALIEKKYCAFDGITATCCCHGVALWVHELITDLEGLDLIPIRQEGERKIEALENFRPQEPWLVPEALIHLARVHILKIVKKMDPSRGGLTDTGNLRSIVFLSTKFCNKLVDNIQGHLSNFIAHKYAFFLEKLPEPMYMHGVLMSTWGKYVSPPYLRSDRRARKYAASMFSMRVCLAHMIVSRSKVAVVNDLMDFSGNVKSRHVSLFEGDGSHNLRPLTQKELSLRSSQPQEPVVIFGGCLYSEEVDKHSLALMMNPWQDQMMSLLLACDVWYPHFPQVKDDPHFDSANIEPEEESLQKVINDHAKIKGVCTKNPSLFCLAHIYVASLKQVLEVLEEKDKNALPCSLIPAVKLT